jgi:Rieske Fe-S protein
MVNEKAGKSMEKGTSPEKEPLSLGKRRLIQGILGLSFIGFFASILTTFKSIVPGKESEGEYVPTVKDGDILAYAEGDKKNQVIDAKSIMVGDAVLAYPKGKEDNYANIIQLIREEVGSFREPTIIDWTDKGYVAYSAICTHLSCTVTWKKRPDIKASHIHCNCHDTAFDPLRGAIVLAGPAPEAIPQIPIEIASNGQIVIKGNFGGPVGPRI